MRNLGWILLSIGVSMLIIGLLPILSAQSNTLVPWGVVLMCLGGLMVLFFAPPA